MKKFICLSFLFMTFSITSFSQNLSLKYGTITDDELKMKVYDKDTSAVAVVLYCFTDCYYDYNNGFKIVTEKKKKIKILKQDGTDKANVVIPYYEENSASRDIIIGLEAISYNLENGNVSKSKLEKKYIFNENISKNFYHQKFTIPNVKVGSVIEYKYKIVSDRFFDVPNQYLQEDIPIVTIKYEVKVPDYFIYNIETKGYQEFSVQSTADNQNFSIIDRGEISTVSVNTKNAVYSLQNVPALKDEPYVWDKDDYRSAVNYELSSTNFPGDIFRSYSTTWGTIENTLREKSDFIPNINKSNPFKDEIKSLTANLPSETEKIQAVFTFIKNKIKWNDKYAFFDNDPKEALKKGTGTNAQINALIIKALKDIGFNAFPVLISQRSNGRLPYSYPSIDKLSTYLVGISTQEGQNIYLDGSSKYGGINLLPVELLVDRAYAMNDYASEKWVNLSSLTRNIESVYILAKMNSEGKLHAKMNRSLSNIEAYYFKNSYFSAKDSTTFIEQFETKNNIKIDSFTITGTDMLSDKVEEIMVFNKDFEISGDFIYINPMLFAHIAENKFTQSDRKLPIEFPYPQTYSYFVNIEIPNGYTISELPKSSRISLNDNQGKCSYIIGQSGNAIQLSYKFDLSQILFPTTDYNMIKEFWGQTAIKNNEMVVLKKL